MSANQVFSLQILRYCRFDVVIKKNTEQLQLAYPLRRTSGTDPDNCFWA